MPDFDYEEDRIFNRLILDDVNTMSGASFGDGVQYPSSTQKPSQKRPLDRDSCT
jgi:hypothetical protein